MRRKQEWAPGRPYKKNRRDVPGFRPGIPGNLGSRAISVSRKRFTRDFKTARIASCGSTRGLWPFDRCTGVNPGSSGNGVSGRACPFHTSLWQRTHWRPTPWSGLIPKLVTTRLHSFPQLTVLARPFDRPHPQQVQYSHYSVISTAICLHCQERLLQASADLRNCSNCTNPVQSFSIAVTSFRRHGA